MPGETEKAGAAGRVGFGRAGLPAGVRQVDCEGPRSAHSWDNWQACDAERQERIATEFAWRWAEEVRDYILEMDGKRQEAGDELSARMWRAWAEFRERRLSGNKGS